MNTVFRDTFIFLETFEKGLNLIGYIPVVGSVSGYIRNNYAKVEIIVGIAVAVFSVGMHLQGNINSGAYLSVGAIFIGHAILNELRSCFELIPCVSLVTTLPYDVIATFWLGRRFFSYV